MNSNNNGGTEPTVTAANTHIQHLKNTTTSGQIESLSRLYGGHQQLSSSEASAQLEAHGINAESLACGGTGRLDLRDKRKGNKAAAYEWTADGQALHWCNFATDERGTIFANKQPVHDRVESATRFQQAEAARRKVKAEKQSAQQQAAQVAHKLWHSGVESGTHNYIEHKQRSGLHGARIDAETGALLIPMWVSGVGIVNVQRIYPNGKKLFLKGARVKGAYSVIGSLNGADRVLVCEGWATAATLFELHSIPVIVAFNAGNLMDVCQALRSRFSDIAVIVAGDDDRQTIGNPGRQKAIEAAEAIGATLAFPDLCKCCTCTDHNDRAICDRRCGRG